MNNQIALAYAIAGLAVAAALILIVGTSGGLFAGSASAPEVVVEAAPSAAPNALTMPLDPSQPLPLPTSPDGGAPEIVYVDAPAAGGRRGHDDDDHERREHEGRGRKHDDDDDDD